MLSFHSYSMIVLIEEDPGKTTVRYGTAQGKPYVEDPEYVAVSLISSPRKAIAWYRYVYYCGAQYLSPTEQMLSSRGTAQCNEASSQPTNHTPTNAIYDVEPESPLHNEICTCLTEFIQNTYPCTRDPQMKEAITAENLQFGAQEYRGG